MPWIFDINKESAINDLIKLSFSEDYTDTIKQIKDMAKKSAELYLASIDDVERNRLLVDYDKIYRINNTQDAFKIKIKDSIDLNKPIHSEVLKFFNAFPQDSEKLSDTYKIEFADHITDKIASIWEKYRAESIKYEQTEQNQEQGQEAQGIDQIRASVDSQTFYPTDVHNIPKSKYIDEIDNLAKKEADAMAAKWDIDIYFDEYSDKLPESIEDIKTIFVDLDDDSIFALIDSSPLAYHDMLTSEFIDKFDYFLRNPEASNSLEESEDLLEDASRQVWGFVGADSIIKKINNRRKINSQKELNKNLKYSATADAKKYINDLPEISMDTWQDNLTKTLEKFNKTTNPEEKNKLRKKLEIYLREGNLHICNGDLERISYVVYMHGHKNSEGEIAPWVIKSHKDGHIISSHKTEEEAKKHLRQIEYFKHKKG